MRRVGVLLPAAANDPEFQARMRAFQEGLEKSGWSIGRNVHLDMRWTTPDAANIRPQPAELVALAPDVILATAGWSWRHCTGNSHVADRVRAGPSSGCCLCVPKT